MSGVPLYKKEWLMMIMKRKRPMGYAHGQDCIIHQSRRTANVGLKFFDIPTIFDFSEKKLYLCK